MKNVINAIILEDFIKIHITNVVVLNSVKNVKLLMAIRIVLIVYQAIIYIKEYANQLAHQVIIS